MPITETERDYSELKELLEAVQQCPHEGCVSCIESVIELVHELIDEAIEAECEDEEEPAPTITYGALVGDHRVFVNGEEYTRKC